MRAEYVNPFIIAAREILQAEVNASVKIGQLSIDPTRFLDMDIKVYIGITGNLEGVVLYAMSAETACRMTGLMLGEEITEVNEIVRSAMAELGNVISGIATREFEKLGTTIDITTPTVVHGQGAQVRTASLKTLVIDLHTDIGDLYMMVGMRQVK